MFEMTLQASISEPVAALVSTTATGRASVTHAPPATRGHTSPSAVLAAAATPFAQSMADPPPTARTTSMPFCLQMAAPLFAVVWRGLGSTPASSNSSMPAPSRRPRTSSYRPLFLMEPPP